MRTRGNKQIWRIAKFIHESATMSGDTNFEDYQEWFKNHVYDRTELLLKKIANNEFTGPDNHDN